MLLDIVFQNIVNLGLFLFFSSFLLFNRMSSCRLILLVSLPFRQALQNVALGKEKPRVEKMQRQTSHLPKPYAGLEMISGSDQL